MKNARDEKSALEGDIRWPFEGALSNDERALILSRCLLRRYAAGALVHGAQDEGVGMILLQSGSLRACMTNHEGKNISLYRLGAGDVCLMTGGGTASEFNYDVIVEADSDCVVTVLNEETTNFILRKNPDIAMWAYRLFAKRFGAIMRTLHRALFWGLDRRVALALLDACGEKDAAARVTQEELARDACSAREAVTRMLRRFSQNGWVRLRRGKIELLDRAALRALAEGEEKRG